MAGTQRLRAYLLRRFLQADRLSRRTAEKRGWVNNYEMERAALCWNTSHDWQNGLTSHVEVGPGGDWLLPLLGMRYRL